jgi:hypothetical protein
VRLASDKWDCCVTDAPGVAGLRRIGETACVAVQLEWTGVRSTARGLAQRLGVWRDWRVGWVPGVAALAKNLCGAAQGCGIGQRSCAEVVEASAKLGIEWAGIRVRQLPGFSEFAQRVCAAALVGLRSCAGIGEGLRSAWYAEW